MTTRPNERPDAMTALSMLQADLRAKREYLQWQKLNGINGHLQFATKREIARIERELQA